MNTSQQEFIERSTAIHHGKFDYSKTIYVSNKTPVTIICPIHGKMTQYPQNHIRGNGCRKCGNLNKKRFPKVETLIAEIEQQHFKLYSDFRKSPLYRSAQSAKILKHPVISQIPRVYPPRDATSVSWLCYAYLFENSGFAYIGITSNMKQRQESRFIRKSRERDPVYLFSLKEGENPIEIILQENIPVEKLPEVENGFIDQYRSLGFTILNTKPGGGVGSFRYKKWSKQDFVRCALQCTSRVDMKKRFHKMYRALLKSEWRLEVLSTFPSETSGKPIICVENGVSYSTIQEASQTLGIHHSAISRALKLRGRAGEYHWRYA